MKIKIKKQSGSILLEIIVIIAIILIFVSIFSKYTMILLKNNKVYNDLDQVSDIIHSQVGFYKNHSLNDCIKEEIKNGYNIKTSVDYTGDGYCRLICKITKDHKEKSTFYYYKVAKE